jgi:hypothetical protein
MAAHAAYDLCSDELSRCDGLDPREKPRLEESQKTILKDNASAVETFGGITIATGLTIAFAGAPLEIPAGFAEAGLGVAGIGAGLLLVAVHAIRIADDPIDNNFKSLARPRPPRPVFVKDQPGTPIDADVANAINAVLENQANAIGLGRAIMTSLNRAQGAAVANEPTYERMRMKNARQYASRLAIVLRESAGLRSKAVSELHKADLVFKLTEDQAYNIRGRLLEKDARSRFRRYLSKYGMDSGESKEIERRFLSQLGDFHQFEAAFPNVLSEPKLASAESEIASCFEEFSKSTYISL